MELELEYPEVLNQNPVYRSLISGGDEGFPGGLWLWRGEANQCCRCYHPLPGYGGLWSRQVEWAQSDGMTVRVRLQSSR